MEIKINLDVTENLKVILENLIDALRDMKPQAQAAAEEKPKASKRTAKKPDETSPKAEDQQKAKPEVEQPKPEATQAVEISTNSVEQNPPEAIAVGMDKAQADGAETDEAEAGKGQTGAIIADLTKRLIERVNDEARDRAQINKNLRAACEKLGLQFPTVPALIQAIGYGNAYKACIGEG